MATKRILEGHKRVGKRFIPPMKQLPNFRSTSFVNDMLPDLIWLGLLTDAFGFLDGTRLFEKIAVAAHESFKTGRGNLALLTTYRAATDPEKASLVDTLENRMAIDDVRDCLAPLNALYEESPVAFLGLPADLPAEQVLIQRMHECVGNHINKYDTAGIVLNGMLLISQLCTDTITFAADMELPDFNAVVDSPDSEAAKRAAGFMRAHAIGVFGMEERQPSWARYFWSRNYELSPCEFVEDVDE